MAIKISRTTDSLRIASPYSPDLPAHARSLSGRWDRAAGEWVFPLGAEPQVRALYIDVYGEWDDQPRDTVTIRCTCDDGACQHTGPLTLGGRVIARAYGRDSGARTADGVIVLSGVFGSGGSMKNWTTRCRENTSFRVLDVPRSKAESLVEDPEWCDTVMIEDQSDYRQPINRDALIMERTKLAARIAEIDALLHQD